MSNLLPFALWGIFNVSMFLHLLFDLQRHDVDIHMTAQQIDCDLDRQLQLTESRVLEKFIHFLNKKLKSE